MPRSPRSTDPGRLAADLLAVAALLLVAALAGCRQAEEVPTARPPLPVRLEAVEAAPFQPTLELLGVVEPRDSVAILARTDGPLHYPPAFPDGLRSGVAVRKGQMLARQRVARADHLLEVARLKAEAAASELERHRESWEQGLESDATFETYKLRAELGQQELRAAEEERSQLELRAPVGGVLKVEQRFPPGTEVRAGTRLAEVLTEARQVRGWAGTVDRNRLRVGQEVRVVGPGSAGPPVSGRILEVAPLEGRSGAFAVLVQPDDPEALPPSGEGVEMEVLLEPRLHAFTVPEEAVVTTADGASVFVAQSSGGELRAERRDVLPGERARSGGGDYRIEILQGLRRGERVVVEGASLLSDGAAIVAVAERPVDGDGDTPRAADPTGTRTGPGTGE